MTHDTTSSPSSVLHFCKDCKWFVPYPDVTRRDLSACVQPAVARYWAMLRKEKYLVTGGIEGAWAENERASTRAGACGVEATLFEPKPADSATVTASEAPNKSTDSAYIAALILILVAFASAIVTALCIKGLE